MTAHLQRNSNVRLLACLLDFEDIDDSKYRFLVDAQHVKYVTASPGAFRGAEDDRDFEPILLSELLPQFRSGNWNHGFVARDADADKAVFTRTEIEQFPGVEKLWHPVKLNERDFTRVDRVRQRVQLCTHPEVQGGQPVLVKLAVWPWEIPWMEDETAAYQWIRQTGIAPRFLGHVTEGKNGRVIGIATEWVDDARAAGPDDLEGCQRTLGRLHTLGIKLGDINRHNFLVREGHEVLLVDFEVAERDCSPAELEEEMSRLPSSLQGGSHRGGVDSSE